MKLSKFSVLALSSVGGLMLYQYKQNDWFHRLNHIYTRDDLKQAIYNNNVEQARVVLDNYALRAKAGLTTIDLNSGYFYSGDGTALQCAMIDRWNPGKRTAIDGKIVELILAVRDANGNPAIDVNHPEVHDSGRTITILDYVMDPLTHFTYGTREKILRSILDLRMSDGGMALNLSVVAIESASILAKAVILNDLACLKTLLNLHVFNVNEIIEWRLLGVNLNRMTLLDYALLKDDFDYKYNLDIVNAIIDAGGLTVEQQNNVAQSRAIILNENYDLASDAKLFFKYLKHETDVDIIEEILDSGSLYPCKRQTSASYVFLQLSNSNNFSSRATLIFNLELLNSRKDYHITTHWHYGDFSEAKSVNDTVISAQPNDPYNMLQVLRRAKQQNEIIEPNEVVFKNAIDFRYLEGIVLSYRLPPTEREVLAKRLESKGFKVVETFNDIKIKARCKI